jgi:hypothetical protein
MSKRFDQVPPSLPLCLSVTHSDVDLRSRLALQANQQSTALSSPISPQLMECSEFERATISLSTARKLLQLQDLQQQQSSDYKPSSGGSISSSSIASALAMRRSSSSTLSSSTPSEIFVRSLDARLQTLTLSIEAQWRARFTQILSHLSDQQTLPTPLPLPSDSRRSLGHLLRGIAAIDKGSFAESLIAEMFTLPLIKFVLPLLSPHPPHLSVFVSFRTHLTQGKIDGSEGRTSFSGLHATLQTILQSLKAALHDPLVVSEEIFSSSASHVPVIDLIVGGIWKPLSSALQLQCSGMFMTGITSIFHRAYAAVQQFLSTLSGICGSEWSEKISRRLSQHESVVQFQQLWKLDLYYKVSVSSVSLTHSLGPQLRSQEIISRLELSFKLLASHGITSQIVDEIYFSTSPEAPAPSIQSLSPDHLKDALATVLQIAPSHAPSSSSPRLSFTQVILVEVLTCLHPKVFIQMIGNKFLMLVIQILNCFESQLLTLIGHRASHGTASTVSATGSSEKESIATGTAGASLVSLSVEDLIFALQDILFVSSWLHETLVPLAEKRVLAPLSSPSSHSSLSPSNPVRNCFVSQVARLKKLIPILWNKMAALITVECRSHLKVSFSASVSIDRFSLSLSNLLLGNSG